MMCTKSQIPDFLTATCEFTVADTPDIGAGFFNTISYNASAGTGTAGITAGVYGVQEGTESPPSRFANYPAIGARLHIRERHDAKAVAQRARHRGAVFPRAVRAKDEGARCRAHRDLPGWKTSLDLVSDVEGLIATFVMNTMSKSAASVALNNGVGNVWGLDDSQDLISMRLSRL